MMSDPMRTGAFVVSLPEELAAEETVELVPRLTQRMSRPPLGVFVNRSVTGTITSREEPGSPESLAAQLSPASRTHLDGVYGELQGRAGFERALCKVLQGTTRHGVLPLTEQLFGTRAHHPRDIVHSLATEIRAHLDGLA